MSLIDREKLLYDLNAYWEDNVLSTLGDAVNIITNAPEVDSERSISMLNSALEISNGVMQLAKNKIIELQASNNRLRGAFNSYHLAIRQRALTVDIEEKLLKELRATPAESLTEHDNVLIEKCAKVCDEQAIEWDSNSKITHLNYTEHCAMVIRALKQIEATE